MIHIIRRKATKRQMTEMLQLTRTYVKLTVDVRREILAGGGSLHADCESELLKDGSEQADVWGADWNPNTQEVTFEALINIRPRQGNRSMVIQNSDLRIRIEKVVRALLGGIEHERFD